MSEGDKERDIKNWIKKKLSELKNNGENEQYMKNQDLNSEKVANVDNLREESEEPKNREERPHLKFKTFLITTFVLSFFVILLLSYIAFFYKSCNNLNYLYSHLEKCNGSLVSLDGIAFTDSTDFPEQGNPFYLEKNGYIIDVRGVKNIRSGEILILEGNVNTDPIVYINVSNLKKKSVIENYKMEEICKKVAIKVNNLEKFREIGRLFVTNLTLSNYSVLPSPLGNSEFIYDLKWKETTLKSFTVLYFNTTFYIDRKYEVCGVILPSYGGILRAFIIK